MAKKVTLEPLDRVRNTITKATGTVVSPCKEPKGSPGCLVLPDQGPKAAVLWLPGEFERISGRARECSRCGSTEHTTFYCPPPASDVHLDSAGTDAQA